MLTNEVRMNKHVHYTAVPPQPIPTNKAWLDLAKRFKWTNLDFKPYKAKLPKPKR